MSLSSNPEFKVSPLTLRFEGDLEAAFLDDYFQKSLSHVRFSVALGVFFYMIFGILDYLMIPQVIEPIWYLRYAIVGPFLIFILILTWTASFKKVMQPALAAFGIAAGFGIIAMTVIAYPPGKYYYYAGLILVLMFGYTFVAARFVYASLSGWTIVIVYEIVALTISHTPPSVWISNSFFFVAANIIGMLACYQIELYKRREFWQRSHLATEQAKSAKLLQEMNDELVLASDIQKSLLPPSTLSWAGGEVACYCKPTLEIGGDFYSYHFFDNNRFALAVGDASGHGIPAALLMAATLSLFDSSFERDLNPCERLSLLDQELVSYCEKRYQNCAFCYLELEGQSVYLANAGGIPPLIRKRNAEVQRQDLCGLPLGHGLGAEMGYVGIQVPLDEGDLAILVTDGAVEAKDSQHNMFGFKRLEQVIAEAPDGSAQAMLDHIVQSVLGFIDSGAPQDDFTIAVLRIGS